MCDTFVVMNSWTKDGSIIFGKNSDRDPNEVQVVLRQPRKKYDLSKTPMQKVTFIEVPQVAETYEVVLVKPVWMWGCEMAFNEFGLVIGNEAVFTKEKQGPEALTGMDMIRLAVERCKSADEALDYILELLATYGQGGNCGYQSSILYHNGFIIADPNGAWILETAGKYWAAKKVKDYGVISNGLSIGKEIDKMHPDLINNAINKKYCKSEEDFDFTKAYASGLHKFFTKYETRRCLAKDFIKEEKEKFDHLSARQLLKLHNPEQEGKEFCTGSMASICVHGGGVISSQCTSSIVAKLSKDKMEFWYTASSLPCISLFKPFTFESDTQFFNEEDLEKGISFWRKREDVHRMILAGRIKVEDHRKSLYEYQDKIDKLVDDLSLESKSKEQYNELIQESLRLDELFIDQALEKAGPDEKKDTVCGNLIFKRFWKKTNANIDSGRTV